MVFVQQMNIKINNDETNLELLRKISTKSNINQRVLADELGFSLGKLNYCLKALKQKGLIKIKRFKKSTHKMGYLYILTAKGLSTKTKITINFMKKKMAEYNELRDEVEINDKDAIEHKQQPIKKIDQNLL